MRSESHGVVRYLKSILPVPQFDYSADEFFGCDGTSESFEKVFAIEILNAHMRASETRVDVAEEMDIMCPGWLAEQFIGQLLPRALPSCVVDGVTNLYSPVEACAWLEDVEMYSRIVVQEIEAYMQDLPDAWRFNESLHQDILQAYFHFAKEYECLNLESSTKPQVQYPIEPGPYAIPLARDESCKNRIRVLQTLLDDAGSNLKNAISVCQNFVKVFELKPSNQDLLLEQYSGQIRHRELEVYTKAIDIQNLVGRVSESEVDESITKLLDFDPADFLLDKLHIRGNSVQGKLQPASSASSVVGGLSLLDENSVAAGISNKHAATNYTMQVMFELPEVLEDRYLDSVFTLKLETYISTLMKPNLVELEDLDSQEIPFQDFEKLVVFPVLTLETSRFHFLQVPSFNISEHQARIPEDVFKAVFRAKALPSSTSASDCVYLDWHLSQVGHCNNHGCFHLHRRVMENELRMEQFQRDVILGKRMPDHLLLISLAEDSLPWHHTEPECGNKKEVYTAAYLHASVSTSLPSFSSFLYSTAVKAADKNLSDQSALTHELRNNLPSVRDQVPLAGSVPTCMDSVLSLMKQARQGELSRDANSMHVSENESYQEGYQGNGNSKNQSHDHILECQVLESASTAVKIPTQNMSSSDIDGALRYNLHSSNYVEPELQVPLHIPVCPSKELPQVRSKPAPPLQSAHKELSPEQSEVDNLIQLSSGQGPHLIVIANILQPSGSIFLHRRSSYQKILGLENEDLQVVERELKLPVDLILNPSTCLTVYTKDYLLRCAKSSHPNSEEFFSYVMNMIVNCHMKALSFAFQWSFMIFEGDLAFTSVIIHILNKLYIYSAAFQMHVQGFISTDPIATDSLILRCIKKMWKTSKRPFNSPISEDLTNGEVCLSTFPSLNPLSSHAILCLNIPIATFISWSHEEQNCALQDFDVRTESLNLMKAQVLYGKLETSAYEETFSECPWPAASEIVAPEVGRHVQAGFTYFPPASEITGCEFEEDSDEVPPREGHSELYPPSCPDDIVPYDSVVQRTSTWNGVCWTNDDDERVTFANHVNHRTQQPNFLEENYGCHNPVDVPEILQQWIPRRKGDDKDVNQSETESERYCDSFKIPNDESYPARLCLNRLPPSVECTTNAVYPSYRNQANDELRRAPLLKISGKRPILALEQYRHQREVSPALRSYKKLKPAVPSNHSRDNGPSSQLDHSLKISRLSCHKFNSPFGRTI